jgi:hypothetical protein
MHLHPATLDPTTARPTGGALDASLTDVHTTATGAP